MIIFLVLILYDFPWKMAVFFQIYLKNNLSWYTKKLLDCGGKMDSSREVLCVKNQYRKVLQFLKRLESDKPVDLKEMLKTYLHLFLVIKDSLDHGDDHQKNESLWILSEFYTLVTEEMKKLRAETGLSEAEILMVGENPNFFTQQQWDVIQDTRKKMEHTGMELTDLLQKRCF